MDDLIYLRDHVNELIARYRRAQDLEVARHWLVSSDVQDARELLQKMDDRLISVIQVKEMELIERAREAR